MKYIKRIIDKDLDLRVKAFGAISIVGPKGCGKTRLLKKDVKLLLNLKMKKEGMLIYPSQRTHLVCF